MVLQYNTTSEDFVKDYLTILNCFFGLTDTELSVLSEFIKSYLFNKQLSNDEELSWRMAFSSITKKHIASVLNYSEINIIDQYILRLKKKKIIVKHKGITFVMPLAIPNEYEITIKLKPNIELSNKGTGGSFSQEHSVE